MVDSAWLVVLVFQYLGIAEVSEMFDPMGLLAARNMASLLTRAETARSECSRLTMRVVGFFSRIALISHGSVRFKR